ncbi:MAG: hypothetical protein AAF567_06530 [Actinomycetota bacterium]
MRDTHIHQAGLEADALELVYELMDQLHAERVADRRAAREAAMLQRVRPQPGYAAHRQRVA